VTDAELTCRELVELVTDYLEDRLPRHERARFEAHLAECAGCEKHLGQIRVILRLARAGRRRPPPVDVEPLLEAFRDWRPATWRARRV
jgi:anti-sigma factor RsiW